MSEEKPLKELEDRLSSLDVYFVVARARSTGESKPYQLVTYTAGERRCSLGLAGMSHLPMFIDARKAEKAVELLRERGYEAHKIDQTLYRPGLDLDEILVSEKLEGLPDLRDKK